MDLQLEEVWGFLCMSKVSLGGFSLGSPFPVLGEPAGPSDSSRMGIQEGERLLGSVSPCPAQKCHTIPALGAQRARVPSAGPSSALLHPSPLLPFPSWKSTGIPRSR